MANPTGIVRQASGQVEVTYDDGSAFMALPVIMVRSDGSFETATFKNPASTGTTAQVATGTTAAQVVPANATRKRCVVQNVDGAIHIQVGYHPGTPAFDLAPGTSVEFTAPAQIDAKSTSGAPNLCYLDESY